MFFRVVVTLRMFYGSFGELQVSEEVKVSIPNGIVILCGKTSLVNVLCRRE